MKPKILHIQKVTGISGSEKHLIDVLSGLADSFDVHFLILEETRRPQDDYARLFEKTGVHIRHMPITKDFSVGLIFKLARFIRHGHFDLVHTHLIHADIHGAFAAKICFVPVISTKHGWDIYEKMNWVQLKLLQGASKIPVHFIAISQALVTFLESFEKVSSRSVSVIHYGLDPTQAQIFNVDDRDFFLRPPLRMLYLGRLVPEKGLVELLQGLKEAQSRGVLCDLRLAGTGPMRSELEILAARLKLKNVTFLGFQKDIHGLLQTSHALILPSYGEGFGLVCLEAMAEKRPVLASNVTALPEIVQDEKTGFLFPPRSAQAVTAVLEKAWSARDRLQAMGEAGFLRLQQHFSRQKMREGTLDVYRRLLQKKA